MSEREALFWEKCTRDDVVCRLCPNRCVIAPGKTGLCGVRENREGVLYSLAYGRLSSLALDPVEKKPLFHVDPGGYLLSLGSYGCNFSCAFCQNWQISQERPDLFSSTPEEIVNLAVQSRKKHPETVGIAYTYNEPTIWLEFVQDCARLAKEQGLRNIVVSNGYISKEALAAILPYIDAFNIDVKGWTQDFYRRIIHGRLEPVLETVRSACEKSWVEVTYLVIPGENDRDEDVAGLAHFLRSISPSIPLHLSRYFPAYRFSAPATPISTLERLRQVAMEDLYYVYIGNAWKRGFADTICPSCKTVLLERGGLELEVSHLNGGACPECGRPMEMVGRVWDGRG